MKRKPCDLVIANATVFNVFTGTLKRGDIAVKDGKIVGIGSGYEAKTVIDAEGLIALPGLIDGHIHVESTMLSPEEFTRCALVRGTTGIVADPHEITNVCGVKGAEYMSEAFRRIGLIDVYLQLPSCVPATGFETSGAVLDGERTANEIGRELFHGLGEMMNFPAVMAGEEDCLKKLAAARAVGKVIDGHAPALTGDGLNAYACAGIATDHEAVSAEDCLAEVERGMYCQIRNGSSAQNLPENCRAIDGYNYRRFLLCSDDKTAYDLSVCGHMDDALRKMVKEGVPAERAVAAATLNIAECYRLAGKGAIAPSYDADIVLVDDLVGFRVRKVIKNGKLVAEDGKLPVPIGEKYLPDDVLNTVKVKPVCESDFFMPSRTGKVLAMRMLPYSLVTEKERVEVPCGEDICVKGSDLLKLAVVERHFATGNIGKALVKGYGLKGGAIGISVAHDSHNLVVLGDNNADMVRIVRLLTACGGGMALVSGKAEEVFPLEIGGLMSKASAEEVIAKTRSIAQKAKEMGVNDGYEPFMSLAFLSLGVIPKLKLTDRGLFDVEAFALTDYEI